MNHKISEILKTGKTTLSYELFPPKNADKLDDLYKTAAEITELKPDFMSITYGAGGSIDTNTVKIASHVQNKLNVNAIAHLTCIASEIETIDTVIKELKENNIQNILALRGDMPLSFSGRSQFKYASDLIKYIKKADSDFCIGGACYPEGHTECEHKAIDIDNLKYKVDCGCDFLTTQMFFDNSVFYNYLYRISQKGINIPVLAGIMPVVNGKQIARICKLSGTDLPPRFKSIVDKFGDNPDAMMQAGIAYASEQIIDLIANGVNGIHVYAMNKSSIAIAIKNNIDKVLESDNK